MDMHSWKSKSQSLKLPPGGILFADWNPWEVFFSRFTIKYTKLIKGEVV